MGLCIWLLVLYGAGRLRKENPIEQGLKRPIVVNEKYEIILRKENPIEQGLKLVSASMKALLL